MDKQENDLKRKMDEYALLIQSAENDIQVWKIQSHIRRTCNRTAKC